MVLNKREGILLTILIVHFLQACLFLETNSRKTTIHPGIFRGGALWADSVSPWTNTIASRVNFPYLLEYVKGQNIIGTKEISGEWARGDFLVLPNGHLPGLYPAREFMYMRPHLPKHEVNGQLA